MRRNIAVLLLAALLFTPCAGFAAVPGLIPPYHWTYHSLAALSERGLINEKVEPGKSAFTPVQVAGMIVMALKHAENDVTKLGDAEASSLRQLAQAYKDYFKEAGYDYGVIRNDIEVAAMRAGLSAIETEPDFSANPKSVAAKAAASVNKFTFDLYRTIAGTKNGGSIVISPYSVTSALAMTYAGARGVTEKQMESVLSLSTEMHKNMGTLINEINAIPTDTAQVSTANAVWPAKGIRIIPDYAQTVRNYYGADLTPLNYAASPEAARKKINGWVARETKQKIKEIVGGGALTKNTRLVLTNAVYFKSKWQNEFLPEKTKPALFYQDAGKAVSVPMMYRLGEETKYARLSGAQMISMPYMNGRFSMLLLLPDEGADIANLEQALTNEEFGRWISSMAPKKVKIYVPKFKTENDYELSAPLSKMGMPSAFDGSADFSGITGMRDIYINNIIHNSFIEVGEEGTEAAAATAVIMMRSSLPPREDDAVTFRCDRPFLYMIRDNNSGALLFIGKFARP